MSAAADGRREYAREILVRLAGRAFRRPATEQEVERLVKLFEAGESREENFAEGIHLAPSGGAGFALFPVPGRARSRIRRARPVRSLNDFEIATRLSYFLWSSMPDDELFSAAAGRQVARAGRDSRSGQTHAQRRQGAALVDNFAGQWLQLRNLKSFAPDKKLFPDFDENLRAAMREETERFFAAVVSEDRSVLDFLDSDFTFVNERLARHYGIADVQRRRVPPRAAGRPAAWRGADASQRAVGHLQSDTHLAGQTGQMGARESARRSPPPPPPGVPELKDSAQGPAERSLRERMEQHRAKAECAVCHNRMDPIGFGLENYNAIGAWRTHDGAFAIDPSGTLPGGKSFAGPAGAEADPEGQTKAVRPLPGRKTAHLRTGPRSGRI